jgi:RNA polymerase primary sigma factor
MFDYKKISFDILTNLKARQKEVLIRRFCLNKESFKDKEIERETLDSIGKDFGVTRERIRQIENDSFNKIKSKVKDYKYVFDYFKKELEKTGGIRKEDVFLNSLNEGRFKQQIFFLLSLSDDFIRFSENENFYSCWSLSLDRFEKFKKYIDLIIKKLE